MITTYMCPSKDIGCGTTPALWCAGCPLRTTAAPAAAAPAEGVRTDAQMLDWMAQHIVEVREHLRYGSRRVMWAYSHYDVEDGVAPFDIRAAINDAMDGKPAPTTADQQATGSPE